MSPITHRHFLANFNILRKQLEICGKTEHVGSQARNARMSNQSNPTTNLELSSPDTYMNGVYAVGCRKVAWQIFRDVIQLGGSGSGALVDEINATRQRFNPGDPSVERCVEHAIYFI